MRIPKSIVSEIKSAIASIDKALAFIDQDKTRIVRISSISAMPAESWTSKTGETGIAINKQIGSELCYLSNARERLRQLITPPIKE